MIQQSDEVVYEELDEVLSVTHLALAVTANIICDYAIFALQEFNLRLPHLMAERETMDENYGRGGLSAEVLVVKLRVVDYGLHGTNLKLLVTDSIKEAQEAIDS
jgi:hypothetical protein